MIGQGVSQPVRLPVLPSLTGVRIFAALYVLVYHLFGSTLPDRPWYDSWIDGGFLGVSLFFVLSGFILAYNAPAVANNRKFYVLRLARVYPLYLAALLWALPNYLHHGSIPRRQAIPASVLLLQTWFGPVFATQINPPGWSLSTEAFFYLMFPLMLPVLRRSLARWKTLAIGLAVLAILPATLVCIFSSIRGQAVGHGTEILLDLPLFRLAEFSVGVVLGLRYAERRRVIPGREAALALLTCIAATGLAVGHLPFAIVRTGLFALPFGWLLYCLAGWPSRLLASAPMQILGEISYGVYLLQMPLAFTIGSLYHGPHHDAVAKTLIALLILPAAYVFYIFVEKPGRRLILRRFGVRSHQKPIETPQKNMA